MKNNLILAVGVGITMSMVSTIPVIAKTDIDLNLGDYPNKSFDGQRRMPVSRPRRVSASAPFEKRSPSGSNFNRSISLKIAQASDLPKTTKIVRPSQQSLHNSERLNLSENPLSSPTQPQEVESDLIEPITLEQALQLSLRNNKDIVEAGIEIEQSRFALRQERAALFPTLDLSGSNLFNYQNNGFLDTIAEQEVEAGIAPNSPQGVGIQNRFQDFGNEIFLFSPSLQLTYDIYDGGNRGALIRTAEKQLRIAELQLEIVVQETLLETAINYYALQNGDATVEIAEAAVRDATRTLEDAQFIEEAGVGTRFDVLRAKVQLAEADQTLVNAVAAREILREQLAETLSIPDDKSLAALGPVEVAGAWELPLPESVALAYENRAELKQLVLQQEIGEEQKTVALSQIRPSIAVSAAYSFLDNFEDTFDITDQYSLGLNVEWRLFDGGAAKASEEQAQKDIEIAKTQFANVRNEIRFAVKQAYLQLESNLNNIDTATDEVDLAEESLRMARLKFREGIGTQTDVIDAQTQLTTARDRLLSSIITYNQSLADLQRQVSTTTDE